MTLLDSPTPIVLSTKRDEILLRLESLKFKKAESDFARDFLWTAEDFLGISKKQVRLLSDDQIEELDKLIFERVNVWLFFFRYLFASPYVFRYRRERRKLAKRRGKDFFPINAIHMYDN